MKANELRIGNWVEDVNTGIIQFTVGDFEHISIHSPAIENYKPIPLTEEWLERFGFEKGYNTSFNSNYLRYQPDLENWEYRICKNNIDGRWPFYQGFINQWSFVADCIEHVHQLQNLYFALKGEELTIQD